MMIDWQTYPFHQLSLERLYDILKKRSEVFVCDQRCIYLDCDGKDSKAYHLMGYQSDQLVAYARVFAPGDYWESRSSFGRVLTVPALRGQGVGRALVQKCIAVCRQHWPDKPIEISGQQYLHAFYCSFGFEAVGPIYQDEGIDHRRFVLEQAIGR